ncbi:uncharacterized protein TRUGW13939_09601 [Talaromyces rugulosus]|uniref:Glutamyl/glutaminyl-tRNA synthetase class Ib anti-codon binding domain-containing protein n=1 Tax=Talaromyces rugulosus TaxID=121627 RepID=A0A7H8R7T1_TALRU|nr:uncharacterized protein TRUGW13939_09601 [Talaromyces rugulosus]QKX62440.1 hypothetical protein TRUGW13939_09601 [Talaromyces rugulosus]
MSKRDLRKLIEEKVVRGWDDPRLSTLKAIRRRSVPPGPLLSFIHEFGVTTTQSSIDVKRFEQSIRRDLERTVPRLMLVLDPVRVTIEDAEEQDLDIPFNSKDSKMGSHNIRLTRSVHIDRSDFREAISFTKDEVTGAVFDKDGKNPKAYIQWVPEGSPTAQVRIHTAPFKSDDPKTAPGGFVNDINPDSETIWPNAMIETGFYQVRQRALWPEAEVKSNKTDRLEPENIRYHAIRIAYFVMPCYWLVCDSDSTDDGIVLNRIVPLKEDSNKGD